MNQNFPSVVARSSNLSFQGLTRDEIRQRLVDLLSNLTAHVDRGFGPLIGRETRLVADLEFDSVDIVQFALAVEELFKRRKLPFEKLLMTEGRYRDDVTVGEVEDFLADCLSVRQ
jgi:acyl carrier protein